MAGYDYKESQILIKQGDNPALKILFYSGIIKEELYRTLVHTIKTHSVRISFSTFEIEELLDLEMFQERLDGSSRIVVLKGDLQSFNKLAEIGFYNPAPQTYAFRNLGKLTTIFPLDEFDYVTDCPCDDFLDE